MFAKKFLDDVFDKNCTKRMIFMFLTLLFGPLAPLNWPGTYVKAEDFSFESLACWVLKVMGELK